MRRPTESTTRPPAPARGSGDADDPGATEHTQLADPELEPEPQQLQWVEENGGQSKAEMRMQALTERVRAKEAMRPPKAKALEAQKPQSPPRHQRSILLEERSPCKPRRRRTCKGPPERTTPLAAAATGSAAPDADGREAVRPGESSEEQKAGVEEACEEEENPFDYRLDMG